MDRQHRSSPGPSGWSPWLVRLVAGPTVALLSLFGFWRVVPVTDGHQAWLVLAMSMSLVSLAAGVYTILQIRRLIRELGRRYGRGESLWRQGGYRCHRCGYDFHGAVGAFCPECGTVRPAPLEGDEGDAAPPTELPERSD